MEQEKLKALAITTATLIADSSQKTTLKWKNELKVLKNIEVHPSAFGTLLLEASIFGHYYVGEIFKGHMNAENKKIFSEELHNGMILSVSLILETADKEKDFSSHKEIIKEMYEQFAPREHKEYSGYDGDSILELFRGRLRHVFNGTETFKIRFIENSFKTKAILKVAEILSGKDNKYADFDFLDQKVIYLLADSLFSEFSGIDYYTLTKQIEENY